MQWIIATTMSRVLVTGGSGFIAAHIINILLERGHDVVTTVRSTTKGDQILAAYPHRPRTKPAKLSYVVVGDIAKEGAFDSAVQSEQAFEYVIHAASPFLSEFTDPVKDLLDPAIRGTTGILTAVQKYAPSVKRVVITSSFAAIVNPDHPPKVYDETSWNPVTWDEAVADRGKAYRGSKTFAEKAAWDFVKEQKPNFDLVVLNPPMVYGPIAHHLDSLDKLNTSNLRIRDFIQGKVTGPELPPTGTFLYVDVRDLAMAHVKAIEVPEAGGRRYFMVAGHCSNAWIVEAIRESHPILGEKLPSNPIDDIPKDVYGYDNSGARDVLGINFRSLKECVADTAMSLIKIQARLDES